MMHYWPSGGFNLWMLLPSVFWILIIAGVFLLLRSYLVTPLQTGGGQSPLEILRQRYAKGELSHDEYLRMKEDLNEEENQ